MRKPQLNLTPTQALYVLSTLVDTGKLGIKRVRDVLTKRDQEIKEIRQRIAELESYGSGSARAPRAKRAVKATAAAEAAPARRKTVMSPKVLAFRRKQGAYMGLVRKLTIAEKARVRAVREKNGIVAAIKLAKSLRPAAAA